MAVYRAIQISFWQDPFVIELTPEEKYFYIYLMTNSKTSQCGIYEISKKIMEIETGYNKDTIVKLLKKFVDFGKIDYNDENNELILINWLKYNPINNINIEKCVIKEVENIKTKTYINILKDKAIELKYKCAGLINAIELLTMGLQEATIPLQRKNNNNNNNKKQNNNNNQNNNNSPSQGQPPSEPKEKIDYQSIIDYYHATCISLPKVKTITDERKKHLKARIEKHGKKALKEVFDKAEASDFLTNRKTPNNIRQKGREKWKADIDFLISPEGFVKILEGKYDNQINVEPTTKDIDIEVDYSQFL